MARRISVTLDLEVQRYIDNAVKTAMVTKAVDEELKGLDRETTVVERKMDELAVTSKVAAKEVDNLGTKAAKTATDMELLDRRIATAQRSVRNLGLEFQATGDKATGVRLGKQRGLLDELEKLKATLTSGNQRTSFLDTILPDPEPTGQGWASRLMSGIAHGFSGISRREIIMALVAVVVAAAPFIGAALSGAIAAVSITGILAGGVLSAIQDPVVQSALSQFSSEIQRIFFGAGASFIEPIRESLGILKGAFENMHLDTLFAKAAPLLTTFVTGIGMLLQNMMPGINKAIERSGPLVNAMAMGFARLGTAIGASAERITASKGTLDGINALFVFMSGTLSALTGLLTGLGAAFHFITSGFTDDIERQIKAMDDGELIWAEYQKSLQVTIPEVDKMGDASARNAEMFERETRHLVDLTNATEDYITHADQQWQANLDLAQAMLDLNENLVKGKKNWDLNTQAGVDNQRQLENTIRAADAKRKADIANSDGSVEAINKINKEYDKELLQILAVASAAGASKDLLDKLAGTYHVNVILSISELTQLNQQNKANAVDKALGIKGGKAGGGSMGPGDWLVGEDQPEIVRVAAGTTGYAYPSVQQYQQQNQAVPWSGGGGGGGQQVVVQNTVYLMDPVTGQVTRARLISDATNRGVSSTTAAAAYP